MMQYGAYRGGQRQPVTETMTLEVGRIYDLQLHVEGLTDPQRAIELLITQLNERYPKLAVTWISACDIDQTIELQVVPVEEKVTLTGESLVVGSLLLFLPQILALLGILVVGISVWQMVAAIPWWAWALLGTGVFLWLFGPMIGKMFRVAEPEVLSASAIYPRFRG